MVLKTGEDKIMQLSSTKAIAMAGPQGDRAHFGEYLEKLIKLYELRHSLPISTNAVANLARDTLATALRKGPYEVNALLGGVDENKGPALFHLDYMGALAKVNFGVHGYASNFTLSVFDKEWKEGMTLEEGKALLGKCKHELATRFLINMPEWKVKLITKDGLAEIDETPAPTAAAAAAVVKQA